jgi:aspartyl-tRNA(Asn)/glutamyl-tRNA(Gln) amidotransferase subunit B
VDANISIRPLGETKLLAKAEVKNMNSFKAVYRALEYEAVRQRKAAARGEKLIQETRGWLEDKGKTVSQRSKEHAHDYRYFPEPDLPPLELDTKWLNEIKAGLPELPEARRDRFMAEYGLPLYDADLLTASRELADYFEAAAAAAGPDIPAKEISNWLLGAASGIMNAEGIAIAAFGGKVSPKGLVALIALNNKGAVSMATAKTVLGRMFATGQEAAKIIAEQGLGQISDGGEIEAAAGIVIKENPQAVADYRAGKEQAVKFLVGQLMRATKGRANPQMAATLIKKKLEEG